MGKKEDKSTYVVRFWIEKDAKLHIETIDAESGEPVQVIKHEFEGGKGKRYVLLLHNKPFYANVTAYVGDREITTAMKSKKYEGIVKNLW